MTPAFSAYDLWRLDGGWPYGDSSAEERAAEEADAALDFKSQADSSLAIKGETMMQALAYALGTLLGGLGLVLIAGVGLAMIHGVLWVFNKLPAWPPVRLLALMWAWRYQPTLIDPMWRDGGARMPWRRAYRKARWIMAFDAASKSGRDPWAAAQGWAER